jgi:hypothetical protein
MLMNLCCVAVVLAIVRLPLIRVITRDPAISQFLQELAASGVRAPFIDEHLGQVMAS